VQLSSVAGVVSNPGFSAYNASKYAMEGFSESLSLEVAPLGINVMLVEPGPYRTKFAGSSLKRAAKTIPAYADTAHALISWVESIDGTQQGDPVKAIRVIIKAVESKNPPLRLPLGGPAIERIRTKMATFEAEIKAWENDSLDTDCDDIKAA
jgi:NAD(P)-dependent dehydrogenase (short-subunit alcohol dehydrogenase family)